MDKDLEKSTDAILRSYETGGGINHIDGANLPSKRALASLCEDLLQLLFPGFHDQESIHSADLRRVTAHRVQTIAERFEAEMGKSLRLQKPDCPEASAHVLVFKFLERIPEVRALLRTDVEAAFHGDPAATTMDEIILAYPYIEAVAIQRMAHVIYQHGLPLIPRIMTEWAHSRTGIDIHPGAKIGSHFFIDHGTGVVIGETAEIGQHAKLYQGVALIARSLTGGQALRGKKRHPTLEDGVTIYAGSTVMGGDTVIGAGTTIGANVSVTHSIPARSLVYHADRQLTIRDKDKRGDGTDDWMI